MGKMHWTTDLRHIHREPASAAVTTGASYGDADASQAYIDMGAATNTLMVTTINVEAIKITANDELYTFKIEVSNSTDFSTLDVAGMIDLGATEVRTSGAADSAAGDQREIFFSTRVNDTEYRYWRLTLDDTGTSPSITFNAYTSYIRA